MERRRPKDPNEDSPEDVELQDATAREATYGAQLAWAAWPIGGPHDPALVATACAMEGRDFDEVMGFVFAQEVANRYMDECAQRKLFPRTTVPAAIAWRVNFLNRWEPH